MLREGKPILHRGCTVHAIDEEVSKTKHDSSTFKSLSSSEALNTHFHYDTTSRRARGLHQNPPAALRPLHHNPHVRRSLTRFIHGRYPPRITDLHTPVLHEGHRRALSKLRQTTRGGKHSGSRPGRAHSAKRGLSRLLDRPLVEDVTREGRAAGAGAAAAANVVVVITANAVRGTRARVG